MALEDLAFQERDSVFRAPSGGDWMLLGLVALGLLGTGLYDWIHLGINDHTGRAVFFGLLLVSIFWGALVYIFKLSMSVLVGPRGISLMRGPWRTELFWRDTARLVERTLPDGGQRYRWVVVMARDGRELRVREDMVLNYARFRAEVYERYLLWRDHGGTWGASGSGPFTATDIVANTVVWWLFGAAMALLPGLYFTILLPESGVTGLVLIGLAGFCCLEALLSFLRRQTYAVGPKEITCKRPAQPLMQLRWPNVSRIDRTRHPAGGLIRVGIAIGRLLMEIAARTDSRVKSFAWSPRVPEYLTLRGEGRHVRIRLHRLTRPDEMLAWVEYYERIGRRGENPSKPSVAPPPPAVSSRPGAGAPYGGVAAGGLGSSSGPLDPWAGGLGGNLPPDAYPTELQPSVGAGRPPLNPHPYSANIPADVPPSVAAAAAYIPVEDDRPEGDSWLWDTSKMPKVKAGSSSSDIFAGPAARPRQPDPEAGPTAPSFVPPPTAGPVFRPPAGGNAPAETPWWLTHDQPPQPAAPADNAWEVSDIYPPAGQPNHNQYPNYPPAPDYPSAYPPPDEEPQPQPYNEPPLASPPFVQRPDHQRQGYSEPPEEQGPSEREMYDENLAESQRWRKQQNWQPPQLPRFGPPPPDGDDGKRKKR